MGALSTTATPKARATPSTVKSSWVGPTPPLVKTTVYFSERDFTSAAMISTSSGIVTTRRRRMPSWLRVFAKTKRFSSCTLPVSSSLPMRRTAAVFPVGLSPIDLGLEGAGHGLAVGTRAEQFFDPPLGAIEAALRNARQPDPLFEQAKRSLERQVAALELLDDVTEPPDGIFERHVRGRGTRLGELDGIFGRRVCE